MVSPVQINTKRTFYNILQISNDADADSITASYQRLKSKYAGVNAEIAKNELLFIEHAYATLSNSDSRSLYDRQISTTANKVTQPVTEYSYQEQRPNVWFSTPVMGFVLLVIALGAYALHSRHSEEIGKINVSKEAVVGNNEVSQMGAENTGRLIDGVLQNNGKVIDRSSEVAMRQLDIQRQDADTRRMEAENRIRLTQGANNQQRQQMMQAQADNLRVMKEKQYWNCMNQQMSQRDGNSYNAGVRCAMYR